MQFCCPASQTFPLLPCMGEISLSSDLDLQSMCVTIFLSFRVTQWLWNDIRLELN